jgi:hypothetical protein
LAVIGLDRACARGSLANHLDAELRQKMTLLVASEPANHAAAFSLLANAGSNGLPFLSMVQAT